VGEALETRGALRLDPHASAQALNDSAHAYPRLVGGCVSILRNIEGCPSSDQGDQDEDERAWVQDAAPAELYGNFT
jgi:hypothetical protein